MTAVISMLILVVVLAIKARKPNAWFRTNFARLRREAPEVSYVSAYLICLRLTISPHGEWQRSLRQPLQAIVSDCGRAWQSRRGPAFELLLIFLVGGALAFLVSFLSAIIRNSGT
jgi:hypothetical protein